MGTTSRTTDAQSPLLSPMVTSMHSVQEEQELEIFKSERNFLPECGMHWLQQTGELAIPRRLNLFESTVLDGITVRLMAAGD